MDINLFLAIAGLTTGVIGVYYGWSQNRQGPARLRYDTRTATAALVAEGSDSRVGLTFDGESVPAVNVISVGFINAGKQRINIADVERPVRIELDGGTAKVLAVSGDGKVDNAAGVEVAIAPLAPGERRLVSIFHTGQRSMKPVVSGGVANLPRGIEDPRQSASPVAALVLFVVVTGMWLAMGIGVFRDPDIQHWNRAALLGWAIVAFPILASAVVLALVALMWLSDVALPSLWKRVRPNRGGFPR